MNRASAELLMKKLRELGSILNSATEIVGQFPDDEAKMFRHQIGNIMAISYGELILPIIKRFPDLDPDRTQI